MNPERSDLSAIFDRARRLESADERRQFLDQACGQDAVLRAKVERLLSAHQQAEADAFLQTVDARSGSQDAAGRPVRPETEMASSGRPMTPIVLDSLEAPAGPNEGTVRSADGAIGTRIGAYKLLGVIGEGGFGTVYLAEQDRPVRRQVALKIIKLGMDTRQVIARFEQERQALAIMDHPHIARVLDAGATETGRPYFVMELVRGVPITQYCDEHHLPLEERLRLFATVCQAVQHAHQKGIIHRDIKPSNVLVTQSDGVATAKVIDFGIAKATGGRLTEKTVFTELRQMIGTPAYMSPEQAGLSELDVDTRTDVYSLGVLLYELLTGTTPFDIKTLLSAGYAEIQRVIREVEPPSPSTRLSTLKDHLPSVAASRHSDPNRLTRRVRGELDWIVMKALEKDRQRRYETPSGLAMDIARFLSGEPVQAAPPSRSYRLRKFVRRHRGSVVTASLLTIALVGGVVGTSIGMLTAQRERGRAQLEAESARLAAAAESAARRSAETAEAKAGAINQFLLTMLGSADLRGMGRDARISQVLDLAARDVEMAFADRPAVEAAVRSILGSTYSSLGMLDEAEPHIRAGVRLNLQVHGERSHELIRSLHDLAFWERQRGRVEASIERYEQAIALAKDVLGEEHGTTISLNSDYANTLALVGRDAEAIRILREARAVRTRLFGTETRDSLILTNSLAVALHRDGKLDEAEALYREGVEIGERVFGLDYPDTLTTKLNLGSMLVSRRKFDEARPLMLDTYERICRVFGESNPKSAAAARAVGDYYDALGRPKDALPYYEEAADILRKAQSERSPEMAGVKERLARAFARQGDAKRALALHRDVYDVNSAIYGAESRPTLGAKLDLANELAVAGEFAESERVFRELLPTCERAFPKDHRLQLIVNNSFGVLLMRQGRFADAEPYVRKSIEIGRLAFGPENADTVTSTFNLAIILREIGRLDESAKLSRESVELSTKVNGPRHPSTAVIRSGHADTLARLGRTSEARRELEDVLAIRRETLGDKSPAVAATLSPLVRVLNDAKEFADAEPLAREWLAIQQKANGPGDAATAGARVQLGRALTGLGRFEEAEEMATSGHALALAADPSAVGTQRAAQGLAELYAAWNAASPSPERESLARKWATAVSRQRSTGATTQRGPANRDAPRKTPTTRPAGRGRKPPLSTRPALTTQPSTN